MIALAAVAGYLIGSLPTATALGSLWGVDLRTEGSGNPGANNALRTGGVWLASLVLAVEITKGALAVVLGAGLGGDLGAVVGGLAAVAGNVFSVWLRFAGGKGMGISAGVLLALWPTALGPTLGLLVVALLITRSSGAATLATIVGLNLMALLWQLKAWPTAWGVERTGLLTVFSVGVAVLLWRKHWLDSPFNRQRLRRRPGPA